VNSGSGTVTVINAETNTVAATIRVQRQPYFIDVDAQGDRAYVANSKSNNVSVLDLARRREIGVIGAGESPGMARIANDGKTLVITNRASGSVSIADVHSFKVRSSFDHCPGATDAIILPDSSKAFVTCSAGHQIMVIGLAHSGGSDPAPTDVLLSFLDVGKTPVHIALKPDGGEAFVSNYDSDTISELTTSSNEVGGAYLMGTHPVRGLVSADNSLLYVSDFGAGGVGIYSIDDGKLLRPGVKVGEGWWWMRSHGILLWCARRILLPCSRCSRQDDPRMTLSSRRFWFDRGGVFSPRTPSGVSVSRPCRTVCHSRSGQI
jgi:YVTN family beta-propeller protein